MTTATADIRRTKSGRPKIAPIDREAILARVHADITDALTDAHTTEAKLRIVADMSAEAQGVLDKHRGHMLKMATSLTVHEGVRAVDRAIGVSREWYSRIIASALGDFPDRPPSWNTAVADHARKAGVRFYRNAIHDLPPVAEKVVYSEYMKASLRGYRDNLIATLTSQGWTRVKIADIIGVKPCRVSQIVSQGRT